MDVYNQFANFYSVIFLLSDPSIFVPQIYGTLQIRYHHFKKNQVLFRFLVKMSAVRLFSGAAFISAEFTDIYFAGKAVLCFYFYASRDDFLKKLTGQRQLPSFRQRDSARQLRRFRIKCG